MGISVRHHQISAYSELTALTVASPVEIARFIGNGRSCTIDISNKFSASIYLVHIPEKAMPAKSRVRSAAYFIVIG